MKFFVSKFNILIQPQIIWRVIPILCHTMELEDSRIREVPSCITEIPVLSALIVLYLMVVPESEGLPSTLLHIRYSVKHLSHVSCSYES
jgi:hypothetical protein